MDLMACTTSVLLSPLERRGTTIFSQYDCAGSAATDVFAQDISIVPGARVPALGFLFHPISWQDTLSKHMAECKAHAVALLPDVKAYWFPLLQLATVRPIEVAPVAADGRFQWPSADGGLLNWRYPSMGVDILRGGFPQLGVVISTYL